MNHVRIITLVLLIVFIDTVRARAFNFLFPTSFIDSPPADTSQKIQALNKTVLINLIDSLLEKDSLENIEIAFIEHYNNLLNENKDVSNETKLNSELSLIDALLDKDSLSKVDVEFLKHYGNFRKENFIKNNVYPGDEFYSDFDESTVFTIAPMSEFQDNMELAIENDSLGIYFHPHDGIITSKYGWRDGRMHKGIDIELNKGTPVFSSFNGMVRIAARKGNYGNVVIIRHYNGLETVYAHLSKIKVKPGDVVKAGQLVGLGGSTGRSSGPHLHYEIRFKGHSLNPLNIVSFEEKKLIGDTLLVKKSRYGVIAYPSHINIYTIQKGDNWYELAKRYGISVKQLCALNGTQKKYYLRAGQKIRIN